MKTKEQIKKFVEDWMNGFEPGTFIKNEHGVVIYSAGPSSLNLVVFFEELLEDFISENTTNQ
jgi:hypothetical protein